MEKKANIILYGVVVLVLVCIITAIAFLYKSIEFKGFKDAVNDFKNKDNLSYVVYEEGELNPIYTLKLLKNKYKVTKKDEPGVIEGDLNKNDTIHFLEEKEAYTPIKNEKDIFKYFPKNIEKKYNILDFFKKDFYKKMNRNGEEVIEFKQEGKDAVEKYIVELKGKTLREYEKKDKNGNVLEKYKYDITLGKVTEDEVESIDRNAYSAKTSEDFEHLKNEIVSEKQKEEKKENNNENNEKDKKQDETNEE